MSYMTSMTSYFPYTLNKKSVCSQSAVASISADLRPQIRSPHTSVHLQSTQALVHGGINIFILFITPCLGRPSH